MLRKAGKSSFIGALSLVVALAGAGRGVAQTQEGTPRSVFAPPQGSIYGSPDGSEATREVANRIRRTRQYGEAEAPGSAAPAAPAGQAPRLVPSRMPGKPAAVAPEEAAGIVPPAAPQQVSPALPGQAPPTMEPPRALPADLPQDGFVPAGELSDQPATIEDAAANSLPLVNDPTLQDIAEPATRPAPLSAAPPEADSSPAMPQGQLPPQAAVEESRNDNLVLMSKGPSLRVETFGPRAIVLGKPARYRVSLINEGDQPGEDAMVRIVLPDWVEVLGGDSTTGETQRQPDGAGGARIVWSLGRIAAKSRENLDLQLVPRKNQMIDMKVDWTFLPAAQTAQIAVRQPQLKLAIDGPTEIHYGDTATYTLTLSNPGTGDAENVSIDVSTAEGAAQTRQIGVIAAGEKEIIELELFARDAGALTINAVASGDGGLKSDASRNVTVRRASLQLLVRGSEYKYAGSLGEYLIRISNNGDAAATNIALAAMLPRGAEYVGGVEGAEGGKGRVDWKIDSLAAGAYRDYLIRCTLEAPGTHRFQVQAAADDDLSTSGDCQTVVEAVADLKLAVNDPKGPIPVGKDVTYEIRVVNRGSKAAEDVKVIAQFSHGIEPVSYEGGNAELVTGQVLFKPVRSLGPGETLVLKVFARASQGGNHRFRTEVTCADQETQLLFEDTTKYFVSKSFQPQDPVTPNPAAPGTLPPPSLGDALPPLNNR